MSRPSTACPGCRSGLGSLDAGGLVGSPAHQAARAVEDGGPAIGVLVDPHGGPDEVGPGRMRRDLQLAAVPADRVVGRHHAGVLDAQDVAPLRLRDRHEGGADFGRRHGKAGVVLRHVGLAQISVGRLHIRDAVQRQFLRQPVLQGPEGPLAATPRLGRVGRDMLDAELRERPADLGQPSLVDRLARLRRVEIVAASVAVERAGQTLGRDRIGKAEEARDRASCSTRMAE